MIYRLLADIVLFTHFAVILFMIFGGFLTWRWPRLIWVHIPAFIYGVLISLAGWICPLTPLENALRGRAGQDGFEGSFIEHYLLSIVYPPGLTPTVQIIMAAALIAVVSLSYWIPRRRAEGRRRKSEVVDAN